MTAESLVITWLSAFFSLCRILHEKQKSSVIIRNGESMISEKWQIDKSYKDTCIELLYENLVSLRAKADITQAEIANIIGISRQTYYAIETGQRTMSWNTYLSLLLFFDTNIEVSQHTTGEVVCVKEKQ